MEGNPRCPTADYVTKDWGQTEIIPRNLGLAKIRDLYPAGHVGRSVEKRDSYLIYLIEVTVPNFRGSGFSRDSEVPKPAGSRKETPLKAGSLC